MCKLQMCDWIHFPKFGHNNISHEDSFGLCGKVFAVQVCVLMLLIKLFYTGVVQWQSF